MFPGPRPCHRAKSDMKYEIEGQLTTHLRFERVDQIILPLPAGGRFRFPTEVSESIFDSFRVEFEARDEAAARADVASLLETVSSWLSYHFNTPVGEVQITRVTPVGGGPATVTATIGGNACIVRPVSDADALSFVSGYQRLASSSPGAHPRAWAVLELYREARATRDAIRKFWCFYDILLILVPPRPGRSDRMAVDRYIRQNYASVPVYRSDDPEVRGDTLSVAIRDSFSHAEGTYNGGHKLDIRQALKSHIEDLHQIVRDTIRKRL
jgi:hypothetical protein